MSKAQPQTRLRHGQDARRYDGAQYSHCHHHHEPTDTISAESSALQTTSGMELNEIDYLEQCEECIEDLSDGITWDSNCSCIGPVHNTACNALVGLCRSAILEIVNRNKLVNQLEKGNAELRERAVAAEADRKSIKAELDTKRTEWTDRILCFTKSSIRAWAERDDFKARLERKEKEWANSVLRATELVEKVERALQLENKKHAKAHKELAELRVLVKDSKIDEFGQRAGEHAAELAATKLQLEEANTALRAAELNNADTMDEIDDIKNLVMSFSPSLDDQDC